MFEITHIPIPVIKKTHLAGYLIFLEAQILLVWIEKFTFL